MPEEVECDSSIVSDLIGGKRTPAIEKLIEQCVVIDIPDKFYNARRLASAG